MILHTFTISLNFYYSLYYPIDKWLYFILSSFYFYTSVYDSAMIFLLFFVKMCGARFWPHSRFYILLTALNKTANNELGIAVVQDTEVETSNAQSCISCAFSK